MIKLSAKVTMARSPSGAGIPSSPAPPVSEFGSASPSRTPGVAQAGLLAAAIVLAALAVAAFGVQVAGAAHGKAFAVGGAAAVLLLAGVLFLLHRQQAAAVAGAAVWEQRAWQAQQQAEDLGRRAGEQDARTRAMLAGLAEAADHLLHVRLPAALEGTAAPPAFGANGAAGDETTALFARVGDIVEAGTAKLREQVDELRQRAEDHSESSRRAVLTLARLLQASALRIQAQAAKMAEDRPADPAVLEASMRVEHAAAQMARNAQSLVVLCGEWPGQQWPDPLALTDVARAGAGRIMSYERVNVSGDHGVAADAGVVEPLIHLVAELLANATQSSPPATQVEVTVQAVQHGAVIEIDDRGIGMEEAQFRQARDVLSGSRLVGLGDLGEFPQTGLAVIGHYVDRHGFGVELRRSPYGGVRAVVLVPDPLVVNTLEPARPAWSAPAASAWSAPAAPGQPQQAPAGGHQAEEEVPGRRLPRRQSLRGQAPPDGYSSVSPAGAAGTAEETTPEEDGAFLAAYLSAEEAATGPDADEADHNTAFPDRSEG
jgi:signal transduction histidine kinase